MAEDKEKKLKEELEALRQTAKLEGETLGPAQQRLNIAKELVVFAKQHQELLNKEGDILRNVRDIENDIVKAKEILKEAEKDTTGILGKNKDLAAKILADKEKELQATIKINNALGLSGKAMGVIDSLFSKVGLDSSGILKNTQAQLIQLEKEGKLRDGIAGKLQGMKSLMGEIGKQIKGSLTDPLTYLAIGLDYSSQIKTIRQELGIAYSDAQGLRMEFSKIAADSGNVAINSADISKSFFLISNAVGAGGTALAKTFPGIVEEAAKLNKLMGLSAEATAGFAQGMLQSSKSAKQVKLEAIGATVAVEKELGVRLPIKKILEETGKINGQIRAQLAAQPELIAKAVAQAKALGMTLEEVAAAGNKILQFESSIEAELKAELLLGKEINLERARLAALTGDYETLAKEINKNVGSFSDFTKLNVLQQQALADAVGMTVDQLSNQLLKKENLAKLAEEARAEGNEELARQLEARSAQEKFNDAVMKLKGLFVDIVGGPLSAFIDGFARIMDILGPIISGVAYILESFVKLVTFDFGNMTVLQGIVGAIAASFAAIALKSKAILLYRKGQQVVEGVIMGYKIAQNKLSGVALATESRGLVRGIARAIAGIFRAFSFIPFGLGIPFAIAAVAGMIGLIKSSKADDFVSTGYGKRTLLAPEGAIALNDRDTVIAGTKLFRGDDVISGPAVAQSAPIDYDQMASAMANVQVRSNIQYDSFAARDTSGQVFYGNQAAKSKFA